MDGVLENRRGNARNGRDREKSHLQAGIEKTAWADGEKTEGGKSNGVERAAVAVDKAAKQVKRHHPQRALHRVAKPVKSA